MRRSFLLLLSVLLAPLALWAKPSAPMNISFQSLGSEKMGDQSRYRVEIKFVPLTASDRVTLQLMLPEKYRLLEGSSYWEGQVVANAALNKSLLIEGPTEKPDTIRLLAEMEMGSAKSSKVVTLKLNPLDGHQESVYPMIVLEKSSQSQVRRIRRE